MDLYTYMRVNRVQPPHALLLGVCGAARLRNGSSTGPWLRLVLGEKEAQREVQSADRRSVVG